MEKVKYLILGAGPAGLTLANCLRDANETRFIILEKESTAGGLCRSVNVDGYPFDIGGGHFLDVRKPVVNDFLFRFMPENEWNKFSRDSRILVNGSVISHPIEANIWQMSINDQVEYLKSIAIAGCNIGETMPDDFVDWIYWKLGKKIADDYMIPYNRKIFGNELNQLGTYWLEKLPSVSFEETLLSCLEKRAYGSQPGHAQFYYPIKFGYGELWLRMAKAIEDNIQYNTTVCGIDYLTKSVMTTNGEIFSAEYIISTIPWKEMRKIIGMPIKLQLSIEKLKHSSIQTKYFDENFETPCHWIYYPDPKISYHRILVRSNFCSGSRGYWTETNSERVDLDEENNSFTYMNEYAYPLNTKDKPTVMEKLLKWSSEKGVYGLGRWGEHQHYNSDVTVERAMNLANIIMNQ